MDNDIGTNMSDPEVFKYWSELAVQDPEQFERARRDAIETVISTASEERRAGLRQLQREIDIERAAAGDPLSACIRINQMMTSSTGRLLDELRAAEREQHILYNALDELTEDQQLLKNPPREEQIISLLKK